MIIVVMTITLTPLDGPLYDPDPAIHKAGNEGNAGQPKVVFIFTILRCVPIMLKLLIVMHCGFSDS